MSTGGFIRRHLFWFHDLLTNRGSVYFQYKDIMKLIRCTDDQVINVHIEKLLKHAILTTKYYRNYSGCDFCEFPIVDKGVYLQHFDEFISSTYKNSNIHKQYTNGSTGIPFESWQNKEKRERVIAELKVFNAICGVPSHEKIVYLEALSDRRTHRSIITQFKQNIWRIDTSDLGVVNMHRMCKYIKEKKGKLLFAYASTLDWLCNYFIEHPTDSEGIELDVVIALGEALNNNTKANCEKFLGKKCHVLSRYSTQEMGILAQQQMESDDFLLNTGSYYFECLKMDNNELCKEGETGRIVVTDLFNYAFPMIRYDTGDMGIMQYNAEGKKVLKKIYGKKKDVLFNTAGSPVSPVSISSCFIGRNEIRQWQLVQEEQNRYILRINCNHLTDSTLQEIIQKLKNLLGNNANINLVYEKEIPELKAGKRKYTVNKMGWTDKKIYEKHISRKKVVSDSNYKRTGKIGRI